VFSASSPFCAHAFNPDTNGIGGVTIKDIAQKANEKSTLNAPKFMLKRSFLTLAGSFPVCLALFQFLIGVL